MKKSKIPPLFQEEKIEKKVAVVKKDNKKNVPKNKEIKNIIPKIKEIEIKEEEENYQITKEEKPSYIKKPGKKIKENIDPPKKIKHEIKLGQEVIVTFLGQPTKGVVIELSEEGMYKVRADRGIILPRAKYIKGEIPDKKYPSYIIKILK